MNPTSGVTSSGSFHIQNQRNKKKQNVSQSSSSVVPAAASSSSKQNGKREKKEDIDALLSELIFVYSKKSRGHIIESLKRNSLATILQIDNLSKFNKIYAASAVLPWKSFAFCKLNLQSTDFVDFVTRFGSIITRIGFCFCEEEDSDEKPVSAKTNNNNNNKKTNGKKEKEIEIDQVPSAKDFLGALTKLPNLEYLLLGPLPRHQSWTSFSWPLTPSTSTFKSTSASELVEKEEPKIGRNKNKKRKKNNHDDNDNGMSMDIDDQTKPATTTTFEFPALKILEIEKYANYSTHFGLISALLSGAPNLVRFDNFQLCLLETFEKLDKLHLIKDLEIVYPTDVTDALWQVSDYFRALRKFEELSRCGKIKLEKLLIVPDEGRGPDDMHNKFNKTFSECYGKILESCKDTLVTFSTYPLIEFALPPPPSSPLKNVTTLKLFEFEIGRGGIWNEEIFTGCTSSELPPSLFPSLEKVELYTSRYFNEYVHFYGRHRNNVKFDSVRTLLVHLGRSSPYDAKTECKPYFFYKLFNLFQNLAQVFPNVIHLKVRSHEKSEDIVNAVCQNFNNKLESFKIETAAEIKIPVRKNKKGKVEPPVNTLIWPDFVSFFQNVNLDKGQKRAKRPTTTTTPNWDKIGQKKKELMDRLKTEFTITDLDSDEILDESPYFEGFRKKGICNMNLVQVARGKLRVEEDGGRAERTELIHYNELMERLNLS